MINARMMVNAQSRTFNHPGEKKIVTASPFNIN